MERKRLKKLRQKEQRAKELSDGEKVDSKISMVDTAEGSSGSTGTPSPRSPSESVLNTSEASLNQDPLSLGPIRPRDLRLDENFRQPLHAEGADQISGHQTQTVNVRWKPITSQRLLPKQIRKSLNGSHTGQAPTAKSSGFIWHGNYKDSKSVPSANGHKIWTPKSKPDSESEGANERDIVVREQTEEQPEEVALSDKTKVLIGSISVALGEGNVHAQNGTMRLDNFPEKLAKTDSSRAAVKLWRPVSHHGSGGSSTTQSDQTNAKMDGVPAVVADQMSSGTDCTVPSEMEDAASESCKNSLVVHTSRDFLEPRLFSREVAEAFLAQS